MRNPEGGYVPSSKRMGETSLVVQWLRLLAPHTGVRIQSLVRELDPTRNNKELVWCKKERRSPVLQLRSGANWCEQTNMFNKRKGNA